MEMAKVGTEPNILNISPFDLVDEIRRHIHSLAAVSRHRGDEIVLAGRKLKIDEVDLAGLQGDLKAAMDELDSVSTSMGKKKP